MKQLIAILALLSMTTIWSVASAQRVKLMDGELTALKGQTSLNIKYDYSNMGVGKYENEQDYIDKKKEKYNEDEPGKGDKWEENWIADRKNRFQPKFEELFNKYCEHITLGAHPNAKYTLILKTLFTEPGFNVGVVRKNALINADVWIVKTANPNEVLAKISIKKSEGRSFGGFDFDSGLRIQEAYANAGKALAKYMRKRIR